MRINVKEPLRGKKKVGREKISLYVSFPFIEFFGDHLCNGKVDISLVDAKSL